MRGVVRARVGSVMATMVALIGWSVVAPPASASATAITAGTPLRALAAPTGRYIGSASEAASLRDDAAYTEISDREFDMLTPTNILKWETTEPERGRFDFSAGDAFAAHAARADQRLRATPLVWHRQLPPWLTQGTFTPDQLRTILIDHVTAEAGHFRGRVYAWDVVNEPIADDGSGLRATPFAALGESYIADAFRAARAADPQARLYLNDYLIESINPKSDALFALVQRLLAQGVPIDGVGFQGHLYVGNGLPDLRPNLERFAALGLDVAITELDVPLLLPATTEALDRQAAIFRGVAEACLAVRRCVGITLWDFTDRYSWIPGEFPGAGAATPFDADLRPKPAYHALVAAFATAGDSGGATPTTAAPAPPSTGAPDGSGDGADPAAGAPPVPVPVVPRYTG